MTLLDQVAEQLQAAAVPFALIGAGALAVHGVSRSTVDQDLLVTDRRVLHLACWAGLPHDILVDPRSGDAEDPLAGVVRFSSAGERDVDLIVGRIGWMDAVVDRAIVVPLPGRDLPVASLADLIVLKLYAGGSQDRWDIEQLLATTADAALREDVESRLNLLPSESGALWQRLVLQRD